MKQSRRRGHGADLSRNGTLAISEMKLRSILESGSRSRPPASLKRLQRETQAPPSEPRQPRTEQRLPSKAQRLYSKP